MSLYYKRDGTPISDILEWEKLFENKKYQIIKKDELKCGCLVSTVWVGLDRSFGGSPPQIFETMIFPEEFQERYATESGAIAGHEKAVKDHIHKPDVSIPGDKNQGR